MEFKSKTTLLEHVKELEDLGYLESEWIIRSVGKKSRATKYYKINFDKFRLKVVKNKS